MMDLISTSLTHATVGLGHAGHKLFSCKPPSYLRFCQALDSTRDEEAVPYVTNHTADGRKHHQGQSQHCQRSQDCRVKAN